MFVRFSRVCLKGLRKIGAPENTQASGHSHAMISSLAVTGARNRLHAALSARLVPPEFSDMTGQRKGA